MDIDDVSNSPTFYMLAGVGYAAFLIMLLVLKGMDQKEIMPWWVKIVTMLVIPIVAAFFSGYAEG